MSTPSKKPAAADTAAILRAVFNYSPAAIAITDDDGRFVQVNEGFCRLVGCTQGELTGRTPEEAPLHVDESWDYILGSLQRGEVIEWQSLRIHRTDGVTLDVVGTYVPVEVDHAKYFVIKVVDVTRMRQAERETLEAAEREQRRIGEALHDAIGGQLTKLSFLSQLVITELEEGSLEHVRRRAEQVQEAAAHFAEEAQRTIHNLMPLVLTDQGLAAGLGELCKQADGMREITCTFHQEDSVDVREEELALHLYRITQEAIHNAIKHSAGDAIHVTLGRGGQGAYCLTIEDNGRGLQEARDRPPAGAGLRSMRHRAELIGARFEIKPSAEGGVAVVCVGQL